MLQAFPFGQYKELILIANRLDYLELAKSTLNIHILKI